MTWKYLPLLNAMLQILLTVGLGSIIGWARVLEEHEFVRMTVHFIFYVALPCLVLNGIGIGVDFYSDKFLWMYIVAFLLLRAIALIIIFTIIWLANWIAKERRYSLGHVAVAWLALTWISTVIVGIPISTAVLGNAQKGRFYGLLAGISSFIFQLPLQLAFFECHVLDSDSVVEEKTKNDKEKTDEQFVISSEDRKTSQAIQIACISPVEMEQGLVCEQVKPASDEAQFSPQTKTEKRWWVLIGGKYVNNRDMWIGILCRVIRNPVLWGIFWGFVLSLSTAGKYLNPRPENPYYIEGLGWIFALLTWLGDTVSPLSLLAMGVWLQAQGIQNILFSIPAPMLALYMLSKLVLVPLLMIGLAKLLSLQNEVGRAAVLIASLPISLASFSLGHQYQIGEAVLAANVAIGTLLMLPTVLIWNVVMDNLNLFPVV
jgi:predicted permease